jgi:hypothetical protein
MTTVEINTYVQDVIQDSAATNTYNIAVSIWDALGGGALTPDPALTTVTFADRNSLGGNVTVLDPPTTTFGLYQDDVVSANIELEIDAYELTDLERAIARGAQANTTFWKKAGHHLPTTTPVTKLVNPKARDAKYKQQVTAAKSGDPAPDGFLYTKIVDLKPDVGADRVILQCAPNIEVVGGGLPTVVLGFTSSQLGISTEGPTELKATNAAKVDRTRAIQLHAPTICSGSYSTEGKRGGSVIASIPISVPVGETHDNFCPPKTHPGVSWVALFITR